MYVHTLALPPLIDLVQRSKGEPKCIFFTLKEYKAPLMMTFCNTTAENGAQTDEWTTNRQTDVKIVIQMYLFQFFYASNCLHPSSMVRNLTKNHFSKCFLVDQYWYKGSVGKKIEIQPHTAKSQKFQVLKSIYSGIFVATLQPISIHNVGANIVLFENSTDTTTFQIDQSF